MRRAVVALITVLAASPSFAHGETKGALRQRPVGCTVIRDVTVVDVAKGGLRGPEDVIVRGEKIASIQQAGSTNSGCRSVDGHNRFLIPGLVDTHVHLFGYSRVGNGDRDTQDAILRLLTANGVTTAVVMEGTPEILQLRREIDEGRRVAAPTLYSAGPLIQAPDTGAPPGRRTFGTPEEMRREVEEEKRLGYDFVKIHGAMPPESYAALLQTARRLDMSVVGHVPDNLGLQAALDGGQVMIAHAESYLQTYFEFGRKLPTDPAEIDAMVRDASARTAKAHVYVQPTLSVFRQIITQVAQPDLLLERPELKLLPAPAIADWMPAANPYLRNWTYADIPRFRAQYRVMAALVRGLRDAGVPLLVGTDDMVPMQLPGFAMRDEMLAMQEAGLTPAEVLRAATYNAARFLKRDTVSGQVAPGMAADLVMLDANPLDDIDNAFRQDGVMLRGTWRPEAELQRDLWSNAFVERGDRASP